MSSHNDVPVGKPTTTAELLHKIHHEENPVSLWSLRETLGNRIDRALKE